MRSQLFIGALCLLVAFVSLAPAGEPWSEFEWRGTSRDSSLIGTRSQGSPSPVAVSSTGGVTSAPIDPHERAELSADARTVVAGSNLFALDLYRRLAAKAAPGNNLLASPLSISTAFGMVYAGARGRTAEQMADVLGFALPDERLHPAFGEWIRDLDASREGYALSIANRVFVQQGFPLRQSYLDITSRDYRAPVEELHFAENPEGSRARINLWVEEKTNDKIRNLLPQGSIAKETRLVLTNAIHFDGKWKYEFDEAHTHGADFRSATGATSEVDTDRAEVVEIELAEAKLGEEAEGAAREELLDYARSPLQE